MAETTKQKPKEVTPKELFHPDPEFDAYYRKVLAALLPVVKLQDSTTNRSNHAIGKQIVEAYNYLKAKSEAAGSSGHGKYGELMNRLTIDLDRSQSTLYDCKTFAEKCPNWDADFANKKFTVKRKICNALQISVEVVEVPGQEMSWREVLEYIVNESDDKDDNEDKTTDKTTKHTITVSDPEQVFVVPMSVEDLRRFRQIAAERGEFADQALADLIRKYIKHYSKSA